MTENTKKEYKAAQTGGTITEAGLKLLADRNQCSLEELKLFLQTTGPPPSSQPTLLPSTQHTCTGQNGAWHAECYQDTLPGNITYVACPLCQSASFSIHGATVPQPRWVHRITGETPSSSSTDLQYTGSTR